MKFADISLLEVGHSIGMVGTVFADEDRMYLCLFPRDQGSFFDADNGTPVDFTWFETPSGELLQAHVLNLNVEEWQTFLRQTDLLETEILTQASDGTLAKVIVRKSQRNIDTHVQWNVWRRDQFRCQYCFGELPLTVDHLVTWEQSGASVEANLLSACKKDNKIRGNLPFEEWLRHPRYREVSKNLPPEIRARNEALVATLDKIPRMVHIRSR